MGSGNEIDLCSRPIWAWEGPLGLAVRLQDAGVSGAAVDMHDGQVHEGPRK